nr:unnamed protein product [Spirometra erinaceieuropaei]
MLFVLLIVLTAGALGEEEASVDICNIPIKKGRCRARLERYGYNSETGKCKKFIFGGCDENENNFHSKKECEMASLQCSSKGT